MSKIEATTESGRGSPVNRRDFLKRVAGASALALGSGGLCAALYDSLGPGPAEDTKALAGLGDFSKAGFAGERGKMAIVRGSDRAAMLERGLKAVGGLESFIGEGDRVLLKVNAAFATPASLGATTHPDLLAAMTRLCLRAGAAQVLVTDNPINDPDGCFGMSGLAEAANLSGAKLVIPRSDLFVPATLPGGRLIKNWPVLAGAFHGVTRVIAMAPVKDHHRAGASMILKNFYGLLGGQRNVFHQGINEIITELSLLVKPTLVVLDGTQSMMTNGPTGGSLSDLK
ncbi:MAG: DUF362 domain-containing protein, partial [Syntrophobacteraceae bacterium]